MTRVVQCWCVILALVCVSGTACRLKRPETSPVRMLEPQLIEPTVAAVPVTTSLPAAGTGVPDTRPVRLLDTQARAHIGRRVLHQQPSGELTEDAVWRWSAVPDRYLDTAIRLELESSSGLRLVDTASAPAIAATLLTWCLAPSPDVRLVGAVQFVITGKDGVVHSHVVQGSEPVTGTLPGDLAAVAGRLLRQLARQGLIQAG